MSEQEGRRTRFTKYGDLSDSLQYKIDNIKSVRLRIEAMCVQRLSSKEQMKDASGVFSTKSLADELYTEVKYVVKEVKSLEGALNSNGNQELFEKITKAFEELTATYSRFSEYASNHILKAFSDKILSEGAVPNSLIELGKQAIAILKKELKLLPSDAKSFSKGSISLHYLVSDEPVIITIKDNSLYLPNQNGAEYKVAGIMSLPKEIQRIMDDKTKKKSARLIVGDNQEKAQDKPTEIGGEEYDSEF